MDIKSKHVKATTSTGRNAQKKMEGYARGPVPEIMVGSKTGKTRTRGYTGPNVATTPRE